MCAQVSSPGDKQPPKDWCWRLAESELPAIAEEDELHVIRQPNGRMKNMCRREGEALHPERESLETLQKLRTTMGDYNFAGQYQQSPAPLGGGLVKLDWFRYYRESDLQASFDSKFQSWDTANTATNMSDYSVCTTWGAKGSKLYLLHLLRKRLEYPELKRTVASHASQFGVKDILIEDKASGIQLLQELRAEGCHGAKAYKNKENKTVRMITVTPTIENGFVYLPESAYWLQDFLHEIDTFPKGKHDDQADSMSQALDWFKQRWSGGAGLEEYYRRLISGKHDPILGIPVE